MKNSAAVSALLILASFTNRDACAATSPLEITTPRGGEVYLVGQTQQVVVTGRFKQVIIDLSRDGGATFSDVGTIDNTVKDKSLQNLLRFTVAGPAATNCIMRARGVTAKGTTVALSGGFVITDGNTLAPVITMDLADGSVTTPKLASGAVTSAKVSSGAASAGFLLTADGAGGADWAALDTVSLDSRYVLKAGDKLTGALTLSGNPTLALQAAPKQYVDAETTRAQNTETLLTTLLVGESTRASNAESTLTTNLSAEVTRAQGAEGTLTTALNAETTRAQAAENTLTTNLSTEVTARTAAGAALQTNIDGKVSKAGDTMTGALVLSGDPSAALHAATKQYVDTTVAVGSPHGVQVFTVNGIFSVPPGVTRIKIRAWGSSGGGGGAGGGALGGTSGGVTSFGTDISISGGGGGSVSAAGASGGAGGVANGGDLNLNGQRGQTGASSSGGNNPTAGGCGAGGYPFGGRGGFGIGISGGAGGGGGYSEKTITTTPATTFPVIIGQAGSAFGGQADGGSNGVIVVEW